MEDLASNNEIPALFHPQASLLSLATELRLMIYDIAKDCDIQCNLDRVLQPHPYHPPRLPLRDLARSCKLLAREIRDHRHSLPASERYATFSIRIHRQDYDFRLTHASCPAKDLKVLNIFYDIFIPNSKEGLNISDAFKAAQWILIQFPSYYRLPAAEDVRVFCQVRMDRREPPSYKMCRYNLEVTRRILEYYHGARSRWQLQVEKWESVVAKKRDRKRKRGTD